jgi:hypothetical protein
MSSCNCTGKCKQPPYTCNGIATNETLAICIHNVPMKFTCHLCNIEKSLKDNEHLSNHSQIGIEKCFERIEKLEDQDKNGYMYLKGQIDALGEHKNRQIDENRKISRKIDELEKDIIEINHPLIEKIEKLEGAICASKKPYKCPVCGGNGNHPDQSPRLGYKVFATTGIYVCIACEGKGIIWG